ncbi:unnamed protein product [Brassicogethes aeneus]|uniref:Uncharacterized protein n=1 Tax=Brassicogethes aeneus TaxID=1431903 RepID=A0A9P0FBV3_BRAAE|nr:unnamed protein product [Brassicogethes aeneus]
MFYSFKQLNNILNEKQIQIAYYGLVNSVLGYGILAWGGILKTHLNNLERVHKRIVKIMFKKDLYYSGNQLLQEKNILNVRQIYAQQLIKWQFKNEKYTKTHAYNTKGSINITTKKATKTIGTKSHTYLAPRLYNFLPISLTNTKYITNKKIKVWLFKQSPHKIENFIENGTFS